MVVGVSWSLCLFFPVVCGLLVIGVVLFRAASVLFVFVLLMSVVCSVVLVVLVCIFVSVSFLCGAVFFPWSDVASTSGASASVAGGWSWVVKVAPISFLQFPRSFFFVAVGVWYVINFSFDVYCVILVFFLSPNCYCLSFIWVCFWFQC